MKKTYTFHFPIKYHPAISTREVLSSFTKDRPKYLRSLEVLNSKQQLLKPMVRTIKHLKYVSTLKSSFHKAYNAKPRELLPSCLKTIKHVKVHGVYYSNSTILLTNKYFSKLKSYSLQFMYKETLEVFKTLREVETLRITYQKMTMGPTMDHVTGICEHGESLKKIRMKNLILEIPKASPGEMMRLVKLIPKSTQMHFELESLPLTFKIHEYKEELAQKIKSIRLRSLTNSYLKSIIESVDYLLNLDHLRLGKENSVGAFELNEHTNYDLFSQLKDFKGLKSLNLNLKLKEPFGSQTLGFFQKVKLPLGLLTFSLCIEKIPLGATRGVKVQETQNLFGQIEKMKKLVSLKLVFSFTGADKNALNEFVSVLPRGLQKLKNLFVDIKAGESLIHTDRVFDWIRTNQNVETVEMDIPLLNYLEIEKKTTFDYNMENLKKLSMSISHESVTIRDFFEDFLVFLARQKKVRYLTLKIKSSHKNKKTIEKLNKYLVKMPKLEYMNLEFHEFEGHAFQNLLGLRPLISKVKSFSLDIKDLKSTVEPAQLSNLMKKEFNDEIRKKGTGFRITLKNMLVV